MSKETMTTWRTLAADAIRNALARITEIAKEANRGDK